MSVELRVPASGESIAEVYIGTWRKAEGEAVTAGETIVELETDKAALELPAPVSGKLVKILKSEGEAAEINEVIALIEEGAAGTVATESIASEPAAQAAEAGAEAEPQHEAEKEPFVMPAARKALAEHGVSPDAVAATGPGQRLLKEDVLKHVEQQHAAAPQPPAATPPGGHGVPDAVHPDEQLLREEEAVPMSPIRRRIAERLVQAQHTAALLTTFNEVDMTEVINLRKEYQEAFTKEYGVKLGFMSFFVKATIDALKRFPQLNAEIRDNHIVYKNYYDIGIAIGGGRGLVVPILRNAERMSFAEIEQAIADFARRARENKLTVDELQGGTFTISNGGVYGSLLSTPIVNPPQSGILGLHSIQDRPVVHNGEIAIRKMMYIALTYDHRIVDGREAVTFLRRIKEVIETPARLLLEI